MNPRGKWFLWAFVLGLSSCIVYYEIPARPRSGEPRLVSIEPTAYPSADHAPPSPAPPVEPKVIIVHDAVPLPSKPSLPDFIDGGLFVVAKDAWSDVYALPTREGDWQAKPGLPSNLFEVRRVLVTSYAIRLETFPDSGTPGQVEYLVDGDPHRHGFIPAETHREIFNGPVSFMRYRATGRTGERVSIHRYWTLGRIPDSTPVER